MKRPRRPAVPLLRLLALILALSTVGLLALQAAPTDKLLLLLGGALACLTLSLVGGGAAQELEMEWRTQSTE